MWRFKRKETADQAAARRRMAAWVRERVDELAGLRGRSVAAWLGREMALREEGADGFPQFEDRGVPCLQLCVLHIALADGVVVEIGTYQDDDEFGLLSSTPNSSLTVELDGIFRTRSLDELPVGVFADVRVELNERGNIRCVELVLDAGQEVILMAGEGYEEPDGGLCFHADDESVLVFTSAAAVDSLNWWRPPD